MDKTPEVLYKERLQIINDAYALKETSRVPMAPFFASVPQRLFGSSYRDLYYDFDKAAEACIEFYRHYPVDAAIGMQSISGKAQEIALPTMIDWPGRPGTRVSDYSSHQVLEHEYIQPEEYRELIDNFDGFMLTKYVPRAFPGLAGLSEISFNPFIVLNTGGISGLFTPGALDAYAKLAEIAKHTREAEVGANRVNEALAAMGIPCFMTGGGEVPFDIISDYFRGTLGAMTDMMEYEDEMLELMDILVDREIKSWKYFENTAMDVRRVHFPMHKAMDGFMSPAQFDKLYWAPFLKLADYLTGIGVQVVVFTEGPFNSRLEQMVLPEKNCLVHFERVDMKRAKETVGKHNCLTGNLPLSVMEFGTKEQVVEQTKALIDTCMPGGGYIFDFDGCMENTKRENLDALYETIDTYGKK